MVEGSTVPEISPGPRGDDSDVSGFLVPVASIINPIRPSAKAAATELLRLLMGTDPATSGVGRSVVKCCLFVEVQYVAKGACGSGGWAVRCLDSGCSSSIRL